jgi:hypothetical protein
MLFGIYPSFLLDGLNYNVSSLIYSTHEVVYSTANLGLLFNGVTVTRRGYSTLALNNKSKEHSVGISSLPSTQIDPWFLTGFTDAFKYLGVKQFSTKRSTTNNNNLSLVVWGTNLTSLVGVGRMTKQESNVVRLPYYQKGVIIGLLLSDG